MTANRREFLKSGAWTCTLPFWNISVFEEDNLPGSIRNLQLQNSDHNPISLTERKQRIQRSQELMAEQRLDAIVMEGTTSCFYFTGMRWGQSERTFVLIIPAQGSAAYVCPKFEEDRARELIVPELGNEIRCWEEHENPFQVIVNLIKDRGLVHHQIGIEERVRFFISQGMRKEGPGIEWVDATPVTAGCRMIKSPAEIALLQKANDITIEIGRAHV